MTSWLRQHYVAISKLRKQILHVLVKHTFKLMCAKNCKITFKFVEVIQGNCSLHFPWITWRHGSRLGKSTWVVLSVPSRLKSLLSTVKSVLSGTICFLWSRLHNKKYVSCTCSPPLLLILYINCLNHSLKCRLSSFSSNTDYQSRWIVQSCISESKKNVNVLG